MSQPFYIAPELASQPPEKCTVSGSKPAAWSCGVLMYLLLTGQPPFYASHHAQGSTSFLEMMKNKGKRLKTMFKKILPGAGGPAKSSPGSSESGEVLFPDELWSHVSQCSRDLAQTILTADPAKRPSLEEIKRHKWFTEKTPQTSELGRQAIHKRLIEFKVGQPV